MQLEEKENEFTRQKILQHEDKVRLVDSDEDLGLELYNYVSCNNSESDFVKQCRGLVFHGDNLVLKGFPYTDEISSKDQIENVFSDERGTKKWKFFDAHEGALLRLFFFSGKWFLSTHRKLNAFRSTWSSKESFGTLFKKALEYHKKYRDFSDFISGVENVNILDRFQQSLDKEKQYMFLLRNSKENRIVCDPPLDDSDDEYRVYHVGTFTNQRLDLETSCGLPKPDQYGFDSLDELYDFMSYVDPYKTQGLLAFLINDDCTFSSVKVVDPEYQKLFNVRGNEPSVKFRYLQVRTDNEMVNALYKLYPDHIPHFEEYENILFDVARNIYRSYVHRFIKKNYVTVPKEEYKVMYECHSHYLADRENNKITLERVTSILNKQVATNLNRMIRRYKLAVEENRN